MKKSHRAHWLRQKQQRWHSTRFNRSFDGNDAVYRSSEAYTESADDVALSGSALVAEEKSQQTDGVSVRQEEEWLNVVSSDLSTYYDESCNYASDAYDRVTDDLLFWATVFNDN